MKVIHKVKLKRSPQIHTIDLPVNAQILDIQIKNNEILCWYLRDIYMKRINKVRYTVIETDMKIEPQRIADMKHIKTIQLTAYFDAHIFMEVKENGKERKRQADKIQKSFLRSTH